MQKSSQKSPLAQHVRCGTDPVHALRKMQPYDDERRNILARQTIRHRTPFGYRQKRQAICGCSVHLFTSSAALYGSARTSFLDSHGGDTKGYCCAKTLKRASFVSGLHRGTTVRRRALDLAARQVVRSKTICACQPRLFPKVPCLRGAELETASAVYSVPVKVRS